MVVVLSFMVYRALYLRAKEIYHNEGIVPLAVRSFKFSINYIKNGFSIPGYHSHKRTDNVDRWEVIKSHLDSTDSNLLDIGCAEAVLTSKFSNEGLFCVGVERSKKQLGTAYRKNRFNDNLGFVMYDVTPKSIDQLPSFDVIMLLTVYHHWCRDFGYEASEEMLRTLATIADKKLFFEPPGFEIERPAFDGYNDTSIDSYYESYLDFIFEGRVQIEHIGNADYAGGDRTDPLFKINCSGFNGTV